MKLKQIVITMFSVGFLSMVSLAYAQMDHGHKHSAPAAKETKNLGICPVMGEKAQSNYSYNYKGKNYYFCCPMCIDRFKDDPQRYLSKIKEIDLIVYQFGFQPKEIKVKKGDIVRILVTSRDVPHGIYIKEYDINVPIKRGEIKKIEFMVDKAGEFPILCSVYCGSGHHQMKGELIVE